MSFTIESLTEQIITGYQTILPTPASFDDISEMSAVKSEYLDKLKANANQLAEQAVDSQYYGVNFNQAEKQNYLAGVKVTSAARDYFTVPAGLYAKFETTAATRNEIDQFIGAAYGEVSQSDQYAIAGNYNLEVVTSFITGTGDFTLYLPIVAK